MPILRLPILLLLLLHLRGICDDFAGLSDHVWYACVW